jgi:hypothetical protein
MNIYEFLAALFGVTALAAMLYAGLLFGFGMGW